MWRKFVRLIGLIFLISAMGIAGGALYTQYVFQEPFYISWSRMLQPELEWQKAKYPSLRPAFEIADRLIPAPGHHDVFEKTSAAGPSAQPTRWSSTVIGPQTEKVSNNDVPGANETVVASSRDIAAAIRDATPGEVITIKPGEYIFSGKSIAVNANGSKTHPITLRAPKFGTVTLLLNTLEGFHVRGAHWIFENLILNGVCAKHANCEHAFHVVGDARNTVIRNNWVSNFNASLKVNGAQGRFPDNGTVAQNVFINDTPRQTTSPVTLVDIVGVNNWVVEANFIADFAKARDNRTSYGAYFKGGGSHNIFERNLIRCDWRHRGGKRIGFSFGGGGTDKNACRDGRCVHEHIRGVMRNNIVMNCPNDVGVYLNKSAETRIHNNLLVDTRGIDARFPETSAIIRNNVIDGRILGRTGGSYEETGNIISTLQAALNGNVSSDVFADPRSGNLSVTDDEALKTSGVKIPDPAPDFCKRKYPNGHTQVGPFLIDGKPHCMRKTP